MVDIELRLADALGASVAIERELGGGGMSRVFLARDTSLDRRVVVKVLAPALAGALSVERFRREILLVAALQHPHIVGVLAAGEVAGVPYFIMPYVDGESLRARLAAGALPVAQVVGILRDVARALDFAHARGIVHRDIKPDNVLLAGGSAMVADFGVAKALDAAMPGRGRGDSTLTRTGTSLGTPQYMAPEQVAGDPAADQRVDLYAWGAMGYEMLAGRTPFAGRSPQALLAAQLTEVPKRPSAVRAGIPAALEAILLRCLEKEPDDRPPSAAALVELLDDPAVMSGAFASVSGAREATPTPARRRWPLAAAAIGALLLAGGALAALSRRGAEATVPPQAPVAGAAAAPAAGSVAVLPLAILSDDPGDARMAAAMTDEITNALARTHGLHVASRTAAAAALAHATDPIDIARALRVRSLLEGTFQREGERVRVTARLVNAEDGFTLWADTYDGRRSELFAMQDRIAAGIGDAMAPEAGPTPAAERGARQAGGDAVVTRSP